MESSCSYETMQFHAWTEGNLPNGLPHMKIQQSSTQIKVAQSNQVQHTDMCNNHLQRKSKVTETVNSRVQELLNRVGETGVGRKRHYFRQQIAAEMKMNGGNRVLQYKAESHKRRTTAEYINASAEILSSEKPYLPLKLPCLYGGTSRKISTAMEMNDDVVHGYITPIYQIKKKERVGTSIAKRLALFRN